MKEQIYTIPVNDAFREDCECPLCFLEKKLEEESINYYLGPSLMEPDNRIDTNEKGFCRRHFDMLYGRQENTLGLALIIETHLRQQVEAIKKEYSRVQKSILREKNRSMAESISDAVKSRKSPSKSYVGEAIEKLRAYEVKCAICTKLDYTMDRYIDVMFYMWFEDSGFRKQFNNKKGFCLYHLRAIMEGIKKYLSCGKAAAFLDNLYKIQFENMDRIQEEVTWFTKKFDYRHKDAPWKNSKDAVPRSIKKLVGYINSR